MGIARDLQEAIECLSRGDSRANAGKRLYRGMEETPDGEPAIGPSAITLGARPHIDIRVDLSGSVHPGTGGMSVAPDTPSNLPRHRRPPEHGGTGKDPLWSIQEISRDSSILGEAISMNLESEIKGALKNQVSLPMLREIVCQYKQNGGTQQAAYVILEKIRHEQIEEPDEDRILELMDFVAGFCAQDQRIWDEILVG